MMEEFIVEKDNKGNNRISRIKYEICVLQALRDKLRCKEIWVVGANRYRNPEEDLPADFEERREENYKALNQPLNAEEFTSGLKQAMHASLDKLDTGLPRNKKVNITTKGNGWISLSPIESQPEPVNLAQLKAEIARRWPMVSLLDVLKDTDLRINFTKHFKSVGAREALSRSAIQKRLILKENLRNAISQVVNEILKCRIQDVWGEGTATCASDSKKFGAWDQNLMTEWHIRYRGRGVMIYWHVEKNSACIYSQVKSCSSSEIAAIIEGILKHCTDMTIEKNFVDSHGHSEIAFAFCNLLGFQLMPRLKSIHSQKLCRPEAGMIDASQTFSLCSLVPSIGSSSASNMTK